MSEPGQPGGFDSRDLAILVVDGSATAGIIAKDQIGRAVEIATEEIEVRVALGNVELNDDAGAFATLECIGMH